MAEKDVKLKKQSDYLFPQTKWANILGKPSSFYTLPLASSSTRGGIKIGYTPKSVSGSYSNLPLKLLSEQAYIELTKQAIITALGFTPISVLPSTVMKTDNAQAVTGAKSFESNMVGANASTSGVSALRAHRKGYKDTYVTHYGYESLVRVIGGNKYTIMLPEGDGTLALRSEIADAKTGTVMIRREPKYGYNAGAMEGTRWHDVLQCNQAIGETTLTVRKVVSSSSVTLQGIVITIPANKDIVDVICDKLKLLTRGASTNYVIKDTIYIGENTVACKLRYYDEQSQTNKVIYIPAGEFAKVDFYLKYLSSEDRPHSFWATITHPNAEKIV